MASFDWNEVPFVCFIEQTAAILGLSVTTIRRELKAGTMAPPPMPHAGKTARYRWSRADLQAFIEGGYRKHDAPGARRRRKGDGRARHAAA